MGAAMHAGSGSGTTGERGRRARTGRLVAWAAVCSAIGALFLPPPASAGVSESLAQARGWLITQQNADGSFGTGGELLPRDSAVAVQALAAGAADPAIDRGADYLGSLQEQVAHYRALRVQGLAATGRPFEPLLDTLGDFRNGDGFGAFGAYYSNLLDTILAVEAYAQDERDRQLLIVELLDYLLASQGSDGGWGFVPGTPSQVYYTGEALWALARLQALDVSPTVVSRARDYLVSQRQPNGSFGSLVETAVAYRALIAAGYQLPVGQPDTVAALLAAQDPNGSWSSDAYTTAEVMRALSAHVPNLIVASLTPAATTITAGTPLDVTAVVRNIGPLVAGASRIELRAGSATGAVRAQAAVPALAPGASHTATFQVSTTGDQGELVLYAVADAGDEVAEGNELDNTQSVRVALRGLPDLAIFPAQITTNPARPQPGASFQVRATVQNLGEMPVASFAYRITRVVAGAPVQTLAQGTTTQSLAPGGSLILTANATLPEGEHTVYVELDPANAIEESYEEDNDATMTFFVVDDTIADFHVTDADLVATPASPAPGTSVSFTLTVKQPRTAARHCGGRDLRRRRHGRRRAAQDADADPQRQRHGDGDRQLHDHRHDLPPDRDHRPHATAARVRRDEQPRPPLSAAAAGPRRGLRRRGLHPGVGRCRRQPRDSDHRPQRRHRRGAGERGGALLRRAGQRRCGARARRGGRPRSRR